MCPGINHSSRKAVADTGSLTARVSTARPRCGPSAKRATRKAYRDSSKHLLERTPLRSILYRFEAFEIRVLSPQGGLIRQSGCIDDAVGERNPE